MSIALPIKYRLLPAEKGGQLGYYLQVLYADNVMEEASAIRVKGENWTYVREWRSHYVNGNQPNIFVTTVSAGQTELAAYKAFLETKSQWLGTQPVPVHLCSGM